MNKQRRAGATETVGVSLDPATKQKLKDLAAERHGGNVSALITEMTEETERRAAGERLWRWYGGPEPTPEEVAAIHAEWEEGWKLARERVAPKPRKAKGRAA